MLVICFSRKRCLRGFRAVLRRSRSFAASLHHHEAHAQYAKVRFPRDDAGVQMKSFKFRRLKRSWLNLARGEVKGKGNECIVEIWNCRDPRA